MVRIFGVPFTVNLCETRLSTERMGESLHDMAEINIQDDLPLERQKAVAIHEFVHEMLDGEEHNDEPFVRRFANTLYGFLEDNRLLRDDWFEQIVDTIPSQTTRP